MAKSSGLKNAPSKNDNPSGKNRGNNPPKSASSGKSSTTTSKPKGK